MAPRILIVRLSALGDIVHTLPLLAALRERWPEATLGWLAEPGGAPLLEGHPLLDRLHVVPRRAWRENKWRALRGPYLDLLAELRAMRYDVAIEAQGLLKSALWGRLAGIPRRIGFAGPEAREGTGLLATDRVRPPAAARHVVERNLALLAPLGIARPETIRFPVHLPEAARERAAQILGDPADAAPLAVLNPGAGWATKIWPVQRMGELARRLRDELGCRVALAWGPGEEELVRGVLAGAGVNGPVDFASETLPPGPGIAPLPPTRFMELGAVLARARLFVGGDTGPTHLAAALGVPAVSMMGPLDARRNGPFGPHCVTIQHAIPRPAPFWRNHRRWCDPRTDLNKVGVEEVLAACRKMLAGS
jgi:lipopolysaccharide heptosyltransferase I